MNQKNKMILAAVLLAAVSFGGGWFVRDISAKDEAQMLRDETQTLKDMIGISDISKEEMRELVEESKQEAEEEKKLREFNAFVNEKFPPKREAELRLAELDVLGDKKKSEKIRAELKAWKEAKQKFREEQAAKMGIKLFQW